MSRGLGRRAFLTSVGVAGLTLAFESPAERRARSARAATVFEPNTWLTIAPDGVTTVHIAMAEMGQGVGTAWAQIVAEELEVDWKDVRIDYPVLGDPKYGRMQTSGSQSIASWFDTLARAGAAARLMLIDAAARRWMVDAAGCVARGGVVRHPASGRSISYGDLVTRGSITKILTPDEIDAIPLKPRGQYRLVGAPIPRLDIPEKVDGQAVFGIDVFLPGMAYAKVVTSPARQGAPARDVDDSAARRVKGYLQTIVTDRVVAVVAETHEAALEARDALRTTWEPGPPGRLDSTAVFADYDRRLREAPGVSFVSRGHVEEAMRQAVRTHTARYTTDLVLQAPMEPTNCVARWVDGRCELFTGTQSHARALRQLSSALGVPASSIRIHQHYLGGGFGLRLEAETMLEAALISRAAARPVKLIRSREEDFARGNARTPTLQALRAGLDASGGVVAWEHVVVAAATGPVDAAGLDWLTLTGSRLVYDVPHQSVRWVRAETGFRSGSYRAIGAGYTSLAVEAFLDELAHQAGADPLTMRLGLLRRQPRLANVLRLVAARAGWGTPLPAGVGRGLACTTYPQEPPGRTQTSTAAVVQARVERASGEVRVEKITCVVDCGLIVNPDGVRAQVEGGLLFGLSGALKERGSVKDGALEQTNFDDYAVLRMDEVPEIDIHTVDSGEAPSGIAEPPVTVVAPALCNAIFAAVGARPRQLPFLPERVRSALGHAT